MTNYIELNTFLNELENKGIFYRLSKIRNEVAVPGQRWGVEFMDDETIEIEKFISDGELYDVKELEILFRDFTD